jgi:YidC/Oxa1 family membrane protein insertase
MISDPVSFMDSTQALLHHSSLSHSMQFALQGLADSLAITADPSSVPPPVVCPGFGEPGWGPFCFLNGNPVFKAFDQFQAFVQNSVVSLHDLIASAGVENAYGLSIVLFTILVRILLFPVTYQQLASSQKTQALTPKIADIKAKYPDKAMQSQLIALLYQESKVNPLAGCLPAILQIPVFLALYRSFQGLATTDTLEEPFLWIPSLAGPVYGTRSSDWIFKNWQDMTPNLGWHDTLAYLSIPIILILAQSLSLQLLSPKSEDPAVQRSQV